MANPDLQIPPNFKTKRITCSALTMCNAPAIIQWRDVGRVRIYIIPTLLYFFPVFFCSALAGCFFCYYNFITCGDVARSITLLVIFSFSLARKWLLFYLVLHLLLSHKSLFFFAYLYGADNKW